MTLDEVQKSTFDQMCACLNQYGQCCVERPTGFGKTKMFMDYVRMHPESNFLFVYDTTSTLSDIMFKYAPQNLAFLSYTAISREMARKDIMHTICGTPWHTIIFDEAHLMGGPNIQKVLLEVLPLALKAGVKVLGGTATKLRTNLVDVSKRFFGGHGVEEYTILDAVRDGIMLEPVWALTAAYNRMLDDFHREYDAQANSFVRRSLRQLDLAYRTLDGISPVYAGTVKDVYGAVPDCMQFIVFYPNIRSLRENMNRDIADFQRAFPTHKVVHAALSSDREHASTISEVERMFDRRGKQVQLIFSVNMLNQAYHSDHLTGVVMYRSTLSDIIFTQQLGRVMSVTAKKPGIVFDNVGNVLRRPDRARALLQQQDKDWTKVASGVSVPRDHLHITCRASKELVSFIDVYTRIKATAHITQEQVDYAKYLTQRKR